MKKLYLLRHAEATSPKGVDDQDRPISEEGKQECKKIARYLASNNIKPDVVLYSDAVRTTQTAKAVFAQQSNVNLIENKKLYLATAGEILKEISKVNDKINSVMVVAHNPGIEKLIIVLAGSGNLKVIPYIKSQYPTCALTCFSCNVEGWKDVEPGKGILEDFVTPDVYSHPIIY